jgi:hypothetical protein
MLLSFVARSAFQVIARGGGLFHARGAKQLFHAAHRRGQPPEHHHTGQPLGLVPIQASVRLQDRGPLFP